MYDEKKIPLLAVNSSHVYNNNIIIKKKDIRTIIERKIIVEFEECILNKIITESFLCGACMSLYVYRKRNTR